MKKDKGKRKIKVQKHQPKESKSFLQNFERNNLIVVLLVIAVAIVVRIIYFMQLQSNSPIYGILIHDSALFNELAHRVVNDGLIRENAFYISPLYIYFLAVIYKLVGDTFNTVRLVQFAMGVGVSVLVFGIGSRLFSKRVGIISGLLAAVYAPFLFFEGNLLGTSVVAFFLTLSVYLISSKKNNKYKYVGIFFAGLFLMLAVTGRPNLIVLAPVPLVYLFIDKGAFKKATYALILCAVIGLLLPITLTTIHNYKVEREIIPLTTHGGINFYIGNHQGATGSWTAPEGMSAGVSAINLEESKQLAEKASGRRLTINEVSQFWYNRAFSYIKTHPLSWIKLSFKKLMLFWSGYETPLNYDYYFHQRYSSLLALPLFNLSVVMSFAIVGMILYFRELKKYWLLYTIIFLTCLSILLFFMADRYRVPIVPFLIIFAAAGIVKLFQLFKHPGKRKIITMAAIVVLITVQMAYTKWRVKHTNFANDCYNLSLAYLIENETKQAVYWGLRAVTMDPEHVDAHYNLGLAYLREQDQDKALDSFIRVTELDSTDLSAQLNAGGLLLMKGETWRALPHLQTAVRLDPLNTKALMNLGLAHYYQRDYRPAIEQWQNLLQFDPENEQARTNIKAAQSMMGR